MGCTTIPVNGPASQINPKINGEAPKFSVTGPDKLFSSAKQIAAQKNREQSLKI